MRQRVREALGDNRRREANYLVFGEKYDSLGSLIRRVSEEATSDHSKRTEHYVVMLSARSTEEDARRGLEAGADDYLTKPFRPRLLREQLQAIVARPARAAAGAPDAAAESEAS